MERSQSLNQALEVLGSSGIDDVEVLGQLGRPMKDSGETADDDELDSSAVRVRSRRS